MDNIRQNRNRIINAAINRLRRKTGSNLLVINLPDGKLGTVEITDNLMEQLLLRLESLALVEYGEQEGKTVINTTYNNAIEINRDTEYLTASGKMIVDDLFNDVVEAVKEKHVCGGIQ